eukprot:XP_016874623.1 GLIPR1-like protein 1 isoform X2 [Homo sapiens]
MVEIPSTRGRLRAFPCSSELCGRGTLLPVLPHSDTDKLIQPRWARACAAGWSQGRAWCGGVGKSGCPSRYWSAQSGHPPHPPHPSMALKNKFSCLWILGLCLVATTSSKIPSITDPHFIDNCIEAHNEWRGKVNPPAADMKYMRKFCKYASLRKRRILLSLLKRREMCKEPLQLFPNEVLDAIRMVNWGGKFDVEKTSRNIWSKDHYRNE